jgi:hypothetical protein
MSKFFDFDHFFRRPPRSPRGPKGADFCVSEIFSPTGTGPGILSAQKRTETRRTEGRRKKEGGRRKEEEGRRKKEEGRRKKEEGRRKKEEGRRKKDFNRDPAVPSS